MSKGIEGNHKRNIPRRPSCTALYKQAITCTFSPPHVSTNPISRCETKLVVTQPKSQSAKATSPICRHTRNHNTTYTTAGLGRPKWKEPNELDRMNKIEYNHTPPTNNSTFEPTNITCIPLSPWRLPCIYMMKYARITSIMGARHSGHFPPPRTNSFAHFEHVHMCPHLIVNTQTSS